MLAVGSIRDLSDWRIWYSVNTKAGHVARTEEIMPNLCADGRLLAYKMGPARVTILGGGCS
jgi:hypothetical protein